MRSACPLSVPIGLHSGTLHSFTSADHEPVATTLEPGAKATKEMGRSSPKLESWFSTDRSRLASPSCVASFAVTSAHSRSMRSRSASSRLSALASESRVTHSRASRSAVEPSVKKDSVRFSLAFSLARAAAGCTALRFPKRSMTDSAPRAGSYGASRSRLAAITSRKRSRRSGMFSPKRQMASPCSRSLIFTSLSLVGTAISLARLRFSIDTLSSCCLAMAVCADEESSCVAAGAAAGALSFVLCSFDIRAFVSSSSAASLSLMTPTECDEERHAKLVHVAQQCACMCLLCLYGRNAAKAIAIARSEGSRPTRTWTPE